MRETITVSIPKTVKRKLDRHTRKQHVNRSEVVRDALRQYFARLEFLELREVLVPEAEKKGIFTDEDVFRNIS